MMYGCILHLCSDTSICQVLGTGFLVQTGGEITHVKSFSCYSWCLSCTAMLDFTTMPEMTPSTIPNPSSCTSLWPNPSDLPNPKPWTLKDLTVMNQLIMRSCQLRRRGSRPQGLVTLGFSLSFLIPTPLGSILPYLCTPSLHCVGPLALSWLVLQYQAPGHACCLCSFGKGVHDSVVVIQH